ncbi:MAG: tetratricopeptide repeat protein [Erysipelotrichaceae bacterium]|nr:tetratricopeptide repeat protein [Erysipelotrichaceae bacterium]
MKKLFLVLIIVFMASCLSACSDAGDHYEKALEYIEANEKDKAIAELDKAIKADPDNALAYVRRGYARMMDEGGGKVEFDPEAALNDFQAALELDPGNEEAIKGVYYVLVMKDQIDEAIKMVTELGSGIKASEEFASFLADVRAGNVKDHLGRTRVSTFYRNGELTRRIYTYFRDDGKADRIEMYDKDGILVGEVKGRYDERGNLLTWASFIEDGTLQRVENEYDSQNRLIKEETYKMDGTLTTTSEKEYDERGNLITEKDYGDNRSTMIRKHAYDEQNRLISDHAYWDSGELVYYSLYEYGENGQMSRIDNYNEKGELTSYMIYSYNEAGQQTRYARYEADGTLVFEKKEGE